MVSGRMSRVMRIPPVRALLFTIAALFPISDLRAEEEIVADLAFRVVEPAGLLSVTLTTVEDPPSGVEPIEGAEGVRYLRRALGIDAELLLAARFRPEPVWLRVDRDFDGDLRDEEPLHLAGPSTTLSVTVTVQLPLDGEITDVPLRFEHHHTGSKSCLHLTMPVRNCTAPGMTPASALPPPWRTTTCTMRRRPTCTGSRTALRSTLTAGPASHS